MSRANPDRFVDDLKVAVRRARVVDEPRDVTADGGVTAPRAIDPEHPDAAVGQVSLFAGFAVGVVSDQLASVVDDARVSLDGLYSEDAVAMHVRTPARDLRKPGSFRHSHADRTKRSNR